MLELILSWIKVHCTQIDSIRVFRSKTYVNNECIFYSIRVSIIKLNDVKM